MEICRYSRPDNAASGPLRVYSAFRPKSVETCKVQNVCSDAVRDCTNSNRTKNDISLLYNYNLLFYDTLFTISSFVQFPGDVSFAIGSVKTRLQHFNNHMGGRSRFYQSGGFILGTIGEGGKDKVSTTLWKYNVPVRETLTFLETVIGSKHKAKTWGFSTRRRQIIGAAKRQVLVEPILDELFHSSSLQVLFTFPFFLTLMLPSARLSTARISLLDRNV